MKTLIVTDYNGAATQFDNFTEFSEIIFGAVSFLKVQGNGYEVYITINQVARIEQRGE